MSTKSFNFKEILSVSFGFLYFYGIMYPKFQTKLDWIQYLFRVSFIMGFLFCGVVLAEMSNMFRSFSLGELEKLIESLFLTLTNLVSLIKYICIFKNQEKMLRLAEEINKKEFQPKSIEQKKILLKYIKFSKLASLLMYSGCAFTCLFWILYSFVIDGGPILPIPAYIPFTINSKVVFVIVYIFEIVGTWIGGYTDLSADCLIASFIMVISAQLELLNNTLYNLQDFSKKEFKKIYGSIEEVDIHSYEFQKIMNKKLLECIVHFQHIFKFCRETNDLFSISIFGQLCISLFVFCATLFEIIAISISPVKKMSMCLFFWCLLSEIFPICYFSNEIIYWSDNLTSSAYKCNWEDCSIEFKQNLLCFMVRTQKVIKLYAGNFAELSLDLFIAILKSSWSYCAVLNQVEN